MKYLSTGLLGVLLLFSGASIQAEVYRWVDEQGRVHYGDKKPEQDTQSLEQVQLRQARPEDDPEVVRRFEAMNRLSTMRAYEREKEAEALVAKKSEQKELASRCQHLQQKMLSEQSVGVVYSYDDKGQRVNWSGDERKAYRAKLQSLFDQHCK